jgi:hypothetical protein
MIIKKKNPGSGDREIRSGTRYPFKGMPPITYFLPTRPHLLPFPTPPTNVISYESSLQYMNL